MKQYVHNVKLNGRRVFTRRGCDWTGRFPWIEDALRSLRTHSATIDGEAVWCGDDGISNFQKLHWRAYDHQVCPFPLDSPLIGFHTNAVADYVL